MAALYYHFPSKLGLLREFLDDAYDVTLARIERRLEGVDGAEARLDSSSPRWCGRTPRRLRPARRVVAVREYTRLDPPDLAAIEIKRKALLDLVEGVVTDGRASGDFATTEPREAARAIVTLATTLVGVYAEIDRSLDEVTTLYQGFAAALVHG